MLGTVVPVQEAPSTSFGGVATADGRRTIPRRALLTLALLALAVGAALQHRSSDGHSSVAPAPTRARAISQQSLLSLPLTAQAPVSAALGADGRAYRVSTWRGGFMAVDPA